jgi:hypothetical protein
VDSASDGGPADGPVPGDWEAGAWCDDSPERVYDCAGNCVDAETAEIWAVDTLCDGVDEAFGMHLDCAAFGFDDGACD